MKIKHITTNDLRKMNGKEGLILQGCGGEAKDWVDGINEMLTKNGILLDDNLFDEDDSEDIANEIGGMSL